MGDFRFRASRNQTFHEWGGTDPLSSQVWSAWVEQREPTHQSCVPEYPMLPLTTSIPEELEPTPCRRKLFLVDGIAWRSCGCFTKNIHTQRWQAFGVRASELSLTITETEPRRTNILELVVLCTAVDTGLAHEAVVSTSSTTERRKERKRGGKKKRIASNWRSTLRLKTDILMETLCIMDREVTLPNVQGQVSHPPFLCSHFREVLTNLSKRHTMWDVLESPVFVFIQYSNQISSE